MKIIFMGTPAFAVPALQALLNSGHQVICVYTQPPKPAGRGHKEQLSPIHSLAIAHNIPVKTPASLRNAESQAEFASFDTDLAVVAAYGLILPREILSTPKFGCINIHPSLLPRWRGAAPIQRTIMAGDRESGVCIMQMDIGLDNGPVLAKHQITLGEQIAAPELHDQLAQLGAELLVKTISHLQDIKATPQDHAKATYAHKLTKEESKIDWHLPAQTINRHIRALNPWPGTFFIYKNEDIKILKAEVLNASTEAAPGTIIDKNLTIACGEGQLHPLIVQRPGRKAISYDEFLRGFSIRIGETLQ